MEGQPLLHTLEECFWLDCGSLLLIDCCSCLIGFDCHSDLCCHNCDYHVYLCGHSHGDHCDRASDCCHGYCGYQGNGCDFSFSCDDGGDDGDVLCVIADKFAGKILLKVTIEKGSLGTGGIKLN